MGEAFRRINWPIKHIKVKALTIISGTQELLALNFITDGKSRQIIIATQQKRDKGKKLNYLKDDDVSSIMALPTSQKIKHRSNC